MTNRRDGPILTRRPTNGTYQPRSYLTGNELPPPPSTWHCRAYDKRPAVDENCPPPVCAAPISANPVHVLIGLKVKFARVKINENPFIITPSVRVRQDYIFDYSPDNTRLYNNRVR